jgi:hypothetical protein
VIAPEASCGDAESAFGRRGEYVEVGAILGSQRFMWIMSPGGCKIGLVLLVVLAA